MQILFSQEEKEYIIITDNDKYALACKKEAPSNIKKSIALKIEAHKRWLEDGGVK